MVIEDEFGNVYPNVWSSFYGGENFTWIDAFDPPLNVQVSVGLSKLQDQQGASNNLSFAVFQQGVAIGLGITAAGLTSTIFGIPAGVVVASLAAAAQIAAVVAQQIAQGDATRANDPPTPDFFTREIVGIYPATIAGIDKLEESYPHLAHLLHALVYLRALRRALDGMQSKLSGAKIAGDQHGEQLQRKECLSLARRVELENDKVRKVVNDATKEIGTAIRKNLPALKTGYEQLQSGGISPQAREHLLKANAPANVLAVIDAMAHDRSLGRTDVLDSEIVSKWSRQMKQFGRAMAEYGGLLKTDAEKAATVSKSPLPDEPKRSPQIGGPSA